MLSAVFLSCFFFVCVCIFVDTQPNVNETSGYFQHNHSTVWQQNIIQLSEKYQQQTSSFDLSPSDMKAMEFFFFFFFLELSFCRRGVIPPQNYSYYFLHTGTHNLKKVMRGRLRESEQTKEAKKNDCRLATPTHNFFVFAYCHLARLNRHIARERSHFTRWLAVLLFAPTSPATSHWTKGLVSLRSIGWMKHDGRHGNLCFFTKIHFQGNWRQRCYIILKHKLKSSEVQW